MWESPIEILRTKINIEMEDEIMKMVHGFGININKEELLKLLKNDRESYEKGYDDGYDMGFNANKWIPVEERLPEKPDYGITGYIVQQGDVIEPYSAYWDGESWTDFMGDECGEITAWMPLPEPHKGGST